MTVGIVAAVVCAAALREASGVFAPLTLAFFIIAIVWPVQQRLQSRLPKLLALAIVLFATIAVCAAAAALAVWAFGRVGHALIADGARYQALYDQWAAWLEERGVSLSGLWAEHFNAGWLLSAARQVSNQVNTTLSFWLITLVYLLLGLLEVEDMRRKLEALGDGETGRRLIQACAETAEKLRRYMIVRTQMSVVTGALVWALAWLSGLRFSTEWGVIAFVLNYIPIIGPFIATLFPTLIAATQFGTWEAVVFLFIGLNVIQFVVGSYVEPRVAGDALAISPFVVLFAVFFWTYLWGFFGAFIGDPIAIAILTFCRRFPSSRFIADLFGGPAPDEEAGAKKA